MLDKRLTPSPALPKVSTRRTNTYLTEALPHLTIWEDAQIPPIHCQRNAASVVQLWDASASTLHAKPLHLRVSETFHGLHLSTQEAVRPSVEAFFPAEVHSASLSKGSEHGRGVPTLTIPLMPCTEEVDELLSPPSPVEIPTPAFYSPEKVSSPSSKVRELVATLIRQLQSGAPSGTRPIEHHPGHHHLKGMALWDVPE